MAPLPTEPTDYSAFQSSTEEAKLVTRVMAGFILMAPIGTPFPETLTDANGKIMPFDPAWWPVGALTDDGWTVSTEVDHMEAPALGHPKPIRKDLTQADGTLTFTAYEIAKAKLREVVFGMDLSDVERNPTTGEVRYKHPRFPIFKDYQAITITVDERGDGPMIDAIGYPCVAATSIPEDAYTKSSFRTWEVALDVKWSNEHNTARIDIQTGPGYLALQEVLGFALAEPTSTEGALPAGQVSP